MSLIQIPDVGPRGEQIRQLLKPLSNIDAGPAWQPKITSEKYIIGVHDGSPSTSEYTNWRFATIVPYVKGMYYEWWKRLNNKSWCLERAYLHILRTDPSTRIEKEFLLLHCDPIEPDNANHAIYKKGPHLHVSAANPPIPHVHIALNSGHLEEVLSSAASLTEALGCAIQMLRQEVLDRLLAESKSSVVY